MHTFPNDRILEITRTLNNLPFNVRVGVGELLQHEVETNEIRAAIRVEFNTIMQHLLQQGLANQGHQGLVNQEQFDRPAIRNAYRDFTQAYDDDLLRKFLPSEEQVSYAFQEAAQFVMNDLL